MVIEELWDACTINLLVNDCWGQQVEIVKYVSERERVVRHRKRDCLSVCTVKDAPPPEMRSVVLRGLPEDALVFTVRIDRSEVESIFSKLRPLGVTSYGTTQERPWIIHPEVKYPALGYALDESAIKPLQESDFLAIPGVKGCVLDHIRYDGERYYLDNHELVNRRFAIHNDPNFHERRYE